MRYTTLLILSTLLILPACREEKQNETLAQAPTEQSVETHNNAADAKVLDIQKVISPMGLTAWLVEDKSLPVISLKFSFRGTGSSQDTNETQGLVQLLSNTMDEGAGEIQSQEFQKALSDNSITLYFNSGRDNFGGQLKTLTRHQDKAFELLTLALTKPRFDEAPVERMRQSNLGRIRSSMGDADWIAARIFNDKAFEGHPYANNSGGTLSSLQNISADELKTYAKNNLTRDKLTIAVTGNITSSELAPIIDKIFGQLPVSSDLNSVAKLNVQNNGQTYLFEKDIPQTIIKIALNSIDKTDADYPTLQVLNHIFGAGGFGSKLMEEAREKRGLTYGIYSQLFSLDNMNSVIISTSTKNESVAEMLEIINQEMDKISTTAITEQELKNAKDYITGSMPLSLTSTDRVSSILLSLQLNNREIDYLDSFKEKIGNVTKEDVQRVAQRVFKSDNLITVLVGKPQNISNIIKVEGLPNVE